MSGFDNFVYLTPYQAVALGAIKPCPGLEEYERRAKLNRPCLVCGQPEWKIVDTELCFTCTTGEANAEAEYELI